MRQTIAVSLLAHSLVIAAIVVLGWQQFATEKPGSAIFVDDVVIGDPEGGEGFERGDGVGIQPTESWVEQAASAAGEGQGPSLSPSQSLPRLQDDRKAGFENGTDTGAVNGVRLTGAGTGSGNGSGSAGAGNPVLAEIRRRIEQSKRYPSQAREQHIEGKVGVQFRIQSNGQVQDVRVTHSSGAPILDDAAVQAVQHSAPLPYYENTIDLSLAFRLR